MLLLILQYSKVCQYSHEQVLYLYMNKPTLYLMLGYPGAGKTTAAEHIARLTGAVLLTSDKIRLELFPNPTFSPEEHAKLYAAIDRRTEQLLQGGSSVIYDANLNRYGHRKEKYNICDKTNAKPKLIWRQTPREIAKVRATDETRYHLIPSNETAEHMFERIAGIIEPPRDDEHAIVLSGEDVTEQDIKTALGL